jgi:hypothetical protein
MQVAPSCLMNYICLLPVMITKYVNFSAFEFSLVLEQFHV